MVDTFDYMYLENDQPAAITAGATFNVLATVFGLLTLAILWSGTCFSLSPLKTKLIALGFYTCAMFDALAFVSFAVDEPCDLFRNVDYYDEDEVSCDESSWKLGRGAIATIFAIAFWILAGSSTLWNLVGNTMSDDEEDAGNQDDEESTLPLVVHKSVEVQGPQEGGNNNDEDHSLSDQ